MFLSFRMRDKLCQDTTYGRAKCGWIIVDVNGLGGPNRVGRDVFWVNIAQDNAYALGAGHDYNWSTCSPSANGGACSVMFLLQ